MTAADWPSMDMVNRDVLGMLTPMLTCRWILREAEFKGLRSYRADGRPESEIAGSGGLFWRATRELAMAGSVVLDCGLYCGDGVTVACPRVQLRDHACDKISAYGQVLKYATNCSAAARRMQREQRSGPTTIVRPRRFPPGITNPPPPRRAQPPSHKPPRLMAQLKHCPAP